MYRVECVRRCRLFPSCIQTSQNILGAISLLPAPARLRRANYPVSMLNLGPALYFYISRRIHPHGKVNFVIGPASGLGQQFA